MIANTDDRVMELLAMSGWYVSALQADRIRVTHNHHGFMDGSTFKSRITNAGRRHVRGVVNIHFGDSD